MRNFILKVIVFVFPIMLLLITAEYILRSIPNDYSYKSKWLEENAARVECLVLGSSHTFHGIQPAYFDMLTFNAAHVSQSLKYDCYIFNRYVDDMKSLKCVILPISYFTLFYSLDKGIENWRAKYYVIYYNYPAEVLWNNFELFPMNLQMWKRIGRYVLLNRDVITTDALGWGVSCTSENKNVNWKDTGKTAAVRHTKNDAKCLDSNLFYLDEIIQACKERNIVLFLLNTPTYITYRENLNQQQLYLMDSICDALADEYDHVYRLDYFADTTFVDEDFYDADHLCEIGAKHLSERINHVIDSIVPSYIVKE